MPGGMLSDRSLHEVIERIGRYFKAVVVDRYQRFLVERGLADSNQVLDFLSAYLKG
jgi:hypothetical protein